MGFLFVFFGFFCIYVHLGILACNFIFLYLFLSDVLYQNNAGGRVPFSSSFYFLFLEEFEKDCYEFFFNCLIEFTSETLLFLDFVVGQFFDYCLSLLLQ